MDDRIQAAIHVAEAAVEAIVDPEATIVHTPNGAARSMTRRPAPAVGQPTSSDAPDELVGRTLAQYRIDEHLGSGSMARVYKAWHLGLERTCALKIIDPRLVARTPKVRDQFWAEARAAANLVHPHVVTIHNVGSDAGYHFIEMEYVPGSVSLRDSFVKQGPFEPARSARLIRQVLQALEAAHKAGMVHRDVKPANVLLTPEGNAKLADFGLVQRRTKVSRSGQTLAGTPTFMAPELFSGTPASPQSDIYAVGVMFYYLLSGRIPFSSERIGKLIRLHQTEPVPDIRKIVPGMNDHLAEIIKRCLAKSPADRYASADELGEELQLIIHHLRDTESLVRQSVEGLDCFVQGGRDTFRIMIPQPGDRLQEVMVEVNEGEQGKNERFLSVFSVCGPADPAYFSYALALNTRLTYGSLSIRYVLGAPMFVMSRTFLRDRVRTQDLRDAILEIARSSDRIEMQMTRLDLY
ncbi:MAG: serine/threonine-protein kinase [Paludisphaera borealis]|uniref:serine/threonine-protein kinase n=1 Tax=Paludisphaera borealis TaxID=1387353 RepID=UPI00284264F7|nr:serine/threonine-protein kinase [Paludisphaera borealis]MDR3620291.1 serine/threonine-protein kinase [Paludisphaera borealis]